VAKPDLCNDVILCFLTTDSGPHDGTDPSRELTVR
jgi:hypothetical protein